MSLQLPGIETPPDQRVRVIEIWNELVLALLRLEYIQPGSSVTHNLPDDLVVLGTVQAQPGRINLLVWSSTFEPLLPGSVIPNWEPTYVLHGEPAEVAV